MKANKKFLNQPMYFWANIRSISQKVGYTERAKRSDPLAKGRIKVPTITQMADVMKGLGLDHTHISESDTPTEFGSLLLKYFEYRAKTLIEYVEPRLMDRNRAEKLFTDLRKKLKPTCPIPMNKQKGKKKTEAYFTGMINMLIESNLEGFECDYDPRELTTITHNNTPLRTLARWVDGAFPSPVNPIAVWEIKEYYNTTTFGSRIADGVYETLLDGMELEELQQSEKINVRHYLMVDAYDTWWNKGKSYLCRIVDMLHMGYVDEVLFGYEVVERLPSLVSEWVKIASKS